MNREDVVQAALTVERWCREHYQPKSDCDCPLAVEHKYIHGLCHVCCGNKPRLWNLEELLRTRGMKDDSKTK